MGAGLTDWTSCGIRSLLSAASWWVSAVYRVVKAELVVYNTCFPHSSFHSLCFASGISMISILFSQFRAEWSGDQGVVDGDMVLVGGREGHPCLRYRAWLERDATRPNERNTPEPNPITPACHRWSIRPNRLEVYKTARSIRERNPRSAICPS